MNPTPSKIKAARKKVKLKVVAVAALMGVSRQSIYNWESGKHPMNQRDWAFLQMKLASL